MRLISFLGTGNYQPVDYYLKADKCCKTPYVAAALACLLPAEEVVVLATEQAEETHGEALVQELTRLGKNPPQWVSILDGKSQTELWTNFDRLVDLLTQTEAEHVVLDITHGFRSQPFFAGAV
ncbi:MAG: CRISPR-associated DxTHG motif protein, partial [Methylohalobius sp.]